MKGTKNGTSFRMLSRLFRYNKLFPIFVCIFYSFLFDSCLSFHYHFVTWSSLETEAVVQADKKATHTKVMYIVYKVREKMSTSRKCKTFIWLFLPSLILFPFAHNCVVKSHVIHLVLRVCKSKNGDDNWKPMKKFSFTIAYIRPSMYGVEWGKTFFSR